MATNRKLMRERRAAKRDQQRQAEWEACGMPVLAPQPPSPRQYVLPSRELTQRQKQQIRSRGIGGSPMPMRDHRLSKVLFAALLVGFR